MYNNMRAHHRTRVTWSADEKHRHTIVLNYERFHISTQKIRARNY